MAVGTVIADSVAGAPGIFLSGLYRAEKAIAERMRRIAAGKLPWPAEAIRLALRSKALVVTGGPGMGKTTILNSILRILEAKAVRLLLCADRPCRQAHV